MDHVFNGTFRHETKDVHWVPEAADGVYSVIDGFDLNLVDLSTNTTTTLLKMSDLKDASICLLMCEAFLTFTAGARQYHPRAHLAALGGHEVCPRCH